MAEVKEVVYRTGFCNDGHHEGPKFELATNGFYNVTCKGEYTIQGKEYVCECECHTQWRQLAELTGVRAQHSPPRALPKIDPILPVQREAPVLPSGNYDLIRAAYGIGGRAPLVEDTDGHLASDDRRTGLSEPESTPSAGTPTGRRRRGQLQVEVAIIVMKWFPRGAEPVPIALTPDLVRSQIKTDPPASVGAIYSVFMNWKQRGWVILSEKPFAMIQPTEAGIQNLPYLK